MSLRNVLNSPGFKIGVELVSSRGIVEQGKTQKTIKFGEQLCEEDDIDWISITDNAGGHPSISPSSVGKHLNAKNKEIIIHMTCKDLNRNGLESKAWQLSSDGFKNILAITGDYPASGMEGVPKPVFDLDSVSLLYLLNKLNNGLTIGRKKKLSLEETDLYLGAVVSNFKKNENELIPQYLKMVKKIEMGASFIINQVGYDAGKMSELIQFQKYKSLDHIPMIGNVFKLSPFTVKLFYQNKIPGVVLTDSLYNQCQEEIQKEDKGAAFFITLAAKMLAIYKGLGYKGGYLGGIHNISEYRSIMDLFYSYGQNDWRQFAKEFQHSQEDEFFMFEKDEDSGLSNGDINPKLLEKGSKTDHVNIQYALSKKFHSLLFTEDKGLYNLGKKTCSKSQTSVNAPLWLYKLEKFGKHLMFDCKDCGDCSLAEISFLCPESQCAKNQRNGPCGGSTSSLCEVLDTDCIWSKAYDRAKYENNASKLLEHAPTIQNHKLEGTSSWANYWLELDHTTNNK